MILIILASGKGSRIKKLTKNNPKILIEINKKKKIYNYLEETFHYFSKIYLVGGYKINSLKKNVEIYKNKKIKIIENKIYSSSNMVHSMFLVKKYIKEDVIVSYGDIIFDKTIIQKLMIQKKNCLPLYKNWLNLWKKRMIIKDIINDAENIKVNKKDKTIISIGEKIKKRLPSHQFMGLAKFNYKDFNKLSFFYKKLGNLKIDFTSFINLSLKNNILKLKYFDTNKLWLEIDSYKDYKVAKEILKNELPKKNFKF